VKQLTKLGWHGDSSTNDIVTTDIVTTGIATTGIGTTVIGHNFYRQKCNPYTTDIRIQLLAGTSVIGTTVIASQLDLQYTEDLLLENFRT